MVIAGYGFLDLRSYQISNEDTNDKKEMEKAIKLLLKLERIKKNFASRLQIDNEAENDDRGKFQRNS
ncbi:unnamed protein product [Rhizophagus irregularis]|nr:unnamed protein product [Rhizophagus irregularis]